MIVSEVMSELEKLGNEQTKKTLMRHGAVEPLFGVKIGDLKPLRKVLKKNHALALELYASGNSDAMYLAGLIADENQVTKAELNLWMKQASWSLISGTAVAALAAESPHVLAVAQKWIDSKAELTAAAGWQTMTHHISIADDSLIDRDLIENLLDRVIDEIHGERNEVKAAMNGFVIAVGSYLTSLTDQAKKVAAKIGAVKVDQGNTSCKTPDALAYIEKVEKSGRLGRRRKSARC